MHQPNGALYIDPELGIAQACADIDNTPSDEHQAQMHFVDAGESNFVQAPASMHLDGDGVLGHDSTRLGAVLSRPLLIQSYSWTHNTRVLDSLDPWQLFFEDPLVTRVCQNFHLIKCKLNVKIVLNGTPFHQGRLQVGYLPFRNGMAVWNGTVGFDDTRHLASQISQLPGTGANPLAVNKSPDFEMVLPWFYDTPYIEVAAMIAGTETPGTLHFQSTLLRTSNTSVVDANFQVYAWASDVEMCIPIPDAVSTPSHGKTEANSDSVVDSSKIASNEDNSENRPDGMVSSITAAFADAAGALKGVPTIGAYMGPVRSALNKATRVAQLFGLSRPAIVTDIGLYRNMPYSTVAHLYGNEAVQKLTFDPKQATTIDPSIHGLPPLDEMAFEVMTSRWSLLETFTWNSTDVSGDPIFAINVNPWMMQRGTSTGLLNVDHLTSVAQASYPFKYWRGPMEFLFIFATSNLQSGRVILTYDPNGNNHQPLLANTQYSQVIDISNADECAVRINWAQVFAYQLCGAFSDDEQYDSGTIAYSPFISNGQIQLSVLNPLVSPDPTTDVDIMVFVRGGPGIEFTVPKHRLNNGAAEVYNIPEGVSDTSYGRAEPKTEVIDFVGARDDHLQDTRTLTYVGDRVVSLRALMKRYILRLNISRPGAVSVGAKQFVASLGYYPNAPLDYRPTAIGAAPLWGVNVNTVGITYFNVFGPCYSGWRGGIRHKTVFMIPDDVTCASLGVFWDDSQEANFVRLAGNNLTTSSEMVTAPQYGYQQSNAGFAMTSHSQQPVVESEVPFNARYKYFSTAPLDQYYTSEQDQLAATMVATVYDSGAGTYHTGMHDYVATGEDFTYLWYLGGGTFRHD